jgi:hypothetical protein
MAIFETYFYFNFVIWIERDEFIKQINKYLNQLEENLDLESKSRQIIKYSMNIIRFEYQKYLDQLYQQYIESLISQKKLREELLKKACIMAGSIGFVFIILLLGGLFNRKKIKWNWICIENILMLLFLGIFEYYFFINIIMNYIPITDAEIKYYAVSNLIGYFNSTK